ncbi:M56 family metallopeptidase [Roseateles sp. DB2]|uniref:M56 family metallopeptidase n=1 Tax=Roseateles sp. DB2 TaxID=3453717 RepID=UPI003EEBFF5E
MTESAWIHLLLLQTLLLSAAVLLLALLRPLLRRLLDAGAVYLTWLLVPLMMLSPALPRLLQGQVLPVPVQALELVMPSWLGERPALASRGSQPALPASKPPGQLASAALLLGLWGLGAGGLLILLVRRQRRFTRGLQRLGRNWQAPAGESPALMGLWQARLVLPRDFEQRFSAREQSLILAHEAVHARRHDNAWNLLAAGLLVLQWFNPLAWWALRRMRLDQELACDAAVLNQAHSHNSGEEPLVKTYVNALLKSHPQRALPVLSTGWAHRHPLLERVKGLRLHRRPAWQRLLGRASAVCLCVGATVLAQAAQPSAAAEVSEPPEQLLAQLLNDEALHGAKTLAVLVQLDSQQGQEAWQHKEFAALYSIRPPVATHRRMMMHVPMGSWCLAVHLSGYPDGDTRAQGELMARGCSRTLTQLQPILPGRMPTALQAALPDAPGQALQAQVSVTLENPRSERFLQVLKRQTQELSAEQRAQLAAMAAQHRKEGEAYQALDKAWQQARAGQP